MALMYEALQQRHDCRYEGELAQSKQLHVLSMLASLVGLLHYLEGYLLTALYVHCSEHITIGTVAQPPLQPEPVH